MIRDETEATAPPIVSSSGLRAGVSLMPDNLVAFAWRFLSASAATRTLDLQYYRWAEDVTGRLLANEVLRAADRGVRVRLLLDDLYIRESELALATLSQHSSIDIRLFNPFQLRSWGAVGSAIEFLLAGYRLNHRMHNKAWIGHAISCSPATWRSVNWPSPADSTIRHISAGCSVSTQRERRQLGVVSGVMRSGLTDHLRFCPGSPPRWPTKAWKAAGPLQLEAEAPFDRIRSAVVDR